MQLMKSPLRSTSASVRLTQALKTRMKPPLIAQCFKELFSIKCLLAKSICERFDWMIELKKLVKLSNKLK